MVTREGWRQQFVTRLLSRTETLAMDLLLGQMEAVQEALIMNLTDLTPDQCAFKPSPKDWSVDEAVSHTCHSNASIREGIRLMMAGHVAEVDEGGDDLTLTSKKPGGALALAQEDREDTVRLLESLSNFSGPGALITVNPYGPLPYKACLLFMARHIADHGKQVAEVKAHPGFPMA